MTISFFSKGSKSKSLYTIIYIILTVAFVPILWVSLYSRPCADDFVYSVNTHKVVMDNPYNIVGVLKEAVDTDLFFYNHWQGLYTSAFLLPLQPGIFGEKCYFIGSWMLLAICFFMVLFFMRILNAFFVIGKKRIIFISAFIFCFIFQSMPYPSEGLFWFNGAWNYTLFFFAILFNMALVYKSLTTDINRYIVLACLISFLISGGNHVTAFLDILFLFWFSVYVLFYKRQRLCKVILPFIVSILGFALMYVAPGTAIRKEALKATAH